MIAGHTNAGNVAREFWPHSVGHSATNFKNRLNILDAKRSETLETSWNHVGGAVDASLLTLLAGEPTARPTERCRRPFTFPPLPTS